VRFLFIRQIYKLQPFSWRNGLVLIITTVTTGILWLIPNYGNAWILIPLKLLVFGGVYATAIIRLNISDDISDLYKQIIIRFSGNKS
jgi:hypothetical protein